MKIKLAEAYFVFDLDDTIYKEIDYKISGINYLVKQISKIYGVDLDGSSFYNVDNFIQEIQCQLKIPSEVAQSFLWQYRNNLEKKKFNLKWTQTYVETIGDLTKCGNIYFMSWMSFDFDNIKQHYKSSKQKNTILNFFVNVM